MLERIKKRKGESEYQRDEKHDLFLLRKSRSRKKLSKPKKGLGYNESDEKKYMEINGLNVIEEGRIKSLSRSKSK